MFFPIAVPLQSEREPEITIITFIIIMKQVAS